MRRITLFLVMIPNQICLQAKAKNRNEPKQFMLRSQDPSKALEIKVIRKFDTRWQTKRYCPHHNQFYRIHIDWSHSNEALTIRDVMRKGTIDIKALLGDCWSVPHWQIRHTILYNINLDYCHLIGWFRVTDVK